MRGKLLARLGTSLAAMLILSAASPVHHKLLVVSVDGLDWRYLRDADSLGLSIPNLRRLMAKGEVADGVIGVWPTVTWPSHTSLITGKRPDEHGILQNGRGTLDPALSYWSVRKLQAKTLWQCARAAGRTTAAITWPVTMEADITYNLPEVFEKRNGGSMDLTSIAAHATPGLVESIGRMYPSFPQQWMDDRTRTLATLYLLKAKQPDLILLHLVDLDSEAHDKGPFTANANAILERSDELIGEMLKGLPADYDIAVVSDHGFERVDHTANLLALMAQQGITGDLEPMGGIVVTRDAKVAAWLRGMSGKPGSAVGREIPHDELVAYAPKLADVVAAFEPPDHVVFGRAATGPVDTPPYEIGTHGFWPLRHDYRSVFVLDGPGIKPAHLGTLQMIDIEARLAAPLGIDCKN